MIGIEHQEWVWFHGELLNKVVYSGEMDCMEEEHEMKYPSGKIGWFDGPILRKKINIDDI